jgi:hypothetical protein
MNINNAEDTKEYIELDENNAILKYLLTSPELLNFGSGGKTYRLGEDQATKYRIEVGKKPIAKNLKTLYSLKNEDLPADLKVFNFYDIWMITFSVGVINEGSGLQKIRQLQFDIEYFDEDQKVPDLTIIDILPQTKFIKLVEGKLQANADITVAGHAEFSTNPLVNSFVKNLSDMANISVNNTISGNCNLSFNVLSQEIVSIGIGNYIGSWIIERTNEKTLIGDQLFIHTLLTHQGLPFINCKVKVSVLCTAPFGLFPIRLEGEWIPLDIILNHENSPVENNS